MRKVFFAIILFTCFLIGCSKEYEINVIVDNETLTYNISDIYFNVDDIEIKENYVLLYHFLKNNTNIIKVKAGLFLIQLY